MALIFGTSVSATDTSGTSIDLPVISTDANALLVLFVRLDGSIQVDSITDTAGLVWGIRGSVDLAGPLDFEEWFAVSEDALVDNVITVTFTDVTTLVTAEVSSFYGADLDAPFDVATLPVCDTTGELSATTVADYVAVIGGYRFTSTEIPTAGNGFNEISGGDFLLTEYQTYGAFQTNLLVTVGDGVGDIEAGIVDAIADGAPPIVTVEHVERVVIFLTGKTSFDLAEFEASNGTVVLAVYDDDTGDLISDGSVYVYEQDIGGVSYRVTAINPVIRDTMVTFTLRDAEQIS